MSRLLPVKPDGDIPIPSDVRERLHWNGSTVVMEEVGETLVLRRHPDQAPAPAPFDWDEFRRHVPRWQGRPASIKDMDDAVGRMFAERGRP
ncbi:MAG TPA: hypothetical protein VF636_05300 [Sphingomonas sp.]|jgi:bifunctional DNA-binding transcriptional regulator/antitoxin component of YhaV-PrlF toxin-antitoxin module